jgi:S-adenosylmethionine:tRNA-ribosyltransferase-isomerase (queuine synthetase)
MFLPRGIWIITKPLCQRTGVSRNAVGGRAFTWKILFDLQRQGIQTAHIVLHTGLSSYMDDELDAQHLASEEEYFITEATAEKINQSISGRTSDCGGNDCGASLRVGSG